MIVFVVRMQTYRIRQCQTKGQLWPTSLRITIASLAHKRWLIINNDLVWSKTIVLVEFYGVAYVAIKKHTKNTAKSDQIQRHNKKGD